MTIDATGPWWRGTEARDLLAYLEAFASERQSRTVDAFRVAICPCGSKAFLIEGDPAEQVVRRTCLNCGTEHLILDCEERWEEAMPVRCRCVECDCEVHELGAGYTFNKKGEVVHVYVGVRCVNCGTMGCFTSWTIDFAPSKHLLDLA